MLMRCWPILLAALVAIACSPGAVVDEPRAEYDQETGRLRRLSLDVNQNGRNDAVSLMDGTRIDRIEIDFDENGKVDRWDFYEGGPMLDRVGFSRLNDGILDSQAFYGPDRKVARIEVSTGRDGRFNRVEFYERGVLVRSEEDTNGDGRPDKWATYRPNTGAAAGEPPYTITSVAFDDLGLGAPQRRVVHDENGRILVETHSVDGSAGPSQLADR